MELAEKESNSQMSEAPVLPIVGDGGGPDGHELQVQQQIRGRVQGEVQDLFRYHLKLIVGHMSAKSAKFFI